MAVSTTADTSARCHTRILPMSLSNIKVKHSDSSLTELLVSVEPESPEAANLSVAASALRTSSLPVAFPTETVYGLGADATRSSAVRGIFKAKNRPADNPLIVHICSLSQLRSLLSDPSTAGVSAGDSSESDPIPSIYHPLIRRFWPGPLTILLPASSQLAPEVTASLTTFGARMPSAPLALALIHASGLPLAAPSANASTRPSPTRAAHVLHDLDGRIELILDGGDCDIGVESTVVDGLSTPPAILRPGGISSEQIRSTDGWERTVIAYKDADEGQGKGEGEGEKPRAPGMKYKHYAPSARVVLVKAGLVEEQALRDMIGKAINKGYKRIGVLRGPRWKPMGGIEAGEKDNLVADWDTLESKADAYGEEMQLRKVAFKAAAVGGAGEAEIIDAGLGCTAEAMARNLFRGFREMDLQKVDLILVEGLAESDGEQVAAVMNRLNKAAEFKASHLEELPF